MCLILRLRRLTEQRGVTLLALALCFVTSAALGQDLKISIDATCNQLPDGGPNLCGTVAPGSTFSRQVSIFYNGTNTGGDVLDVTFILTGGMHLAGSISSNPLSAAAGCHNVNGNADLVECDSSQQYVVGSPFRFTLPLREDANASDNFFTSSLGVDVHSGKFGQTNDKFTFEIGDPKPDLTISLRHQKPEQLTPVAVYSYNIAVYNYGKSPSSGLITVKDKLPANFTVSDELLGRPGFNLDKSTNTLTYVTNAVVAPVGFFGGFEIVVPGRLDGLTTDVVLNQASVSGGGDVDPTNNSSEIDRFNPVGFDISVSEHFRLRLDGTIDWTVHVSNEGDVAYPDTLSVRDIFAFGVEVVSIDNGVLPCSLTVEEGGTPGVLCTIQGMAAHSVRTFGISVRRPNNERMRTRVEVDGPDVHFEIGQSADSPSPSPVPQTPVSTVTGRR